MLLLLQPILPLLDSPGRCLYFLFSCAARCALHVANEHVTQQMVQLRPGSCAAAPIPDPVPVLLLPDPVSASVHSHQVVCYT